MVAHQIGPAGARWQKRVCRYATDEIWVRNGVRVNPHKHHQKYGGIFSSVHCPMRNLSSSVVVHREAEQIGL